MRRVLTVLALFVALLPSLRAALAVGDVKVSQATRISPPAYTDRFTTPAANTLWGFDADGRPAVVTIGVNLQLVDGVLIAAGGEGGTVASVTGTAGEVTASPTSGFVVVSLPAALTFTGKTITGGIFTSGTFNGVTLSGSSASLAVTGSASVSGVNTGDQTSVTGNAGTASALQTARTINGTSFDGTANITVAAAASTLTGTTLNSTVVTSSLTSAAGGAFGTAAFTAASAYEAALGNPGVNGYVLSSTTAGVRSWVAQSGGGGGSGTVTSVSVTTANGVSGSVATDTTTPAISIVLGAITPTSVNGIVLSGSSTPTLAVTGTSSISGTNTGDQTLNSLLPTQTGNSGKYLKTDGTSTSWDTPSGGSGSPAGSSTQVQYNDSGSFAASANFAYASGSLNLIRDLAANASGDGLTLLNTAAASSGNQRKSPLLVLGGNGWKTDSTAASRGVRFSFETVPVQGTSDPTGMFYISSDINSAGYVSRLALATDGKTYLGSPTSAGYLTGLTGDIAITAQGTNKGIQLTPTGTGFVRTDITTGIAQIMRASSSTGYASYRIYNDQNVGSRALEMGYSGSAYSGSILSGGTAGESAYIATTGAYPLAIGTNNLTRINLTAAGKIELLGGISNSATASANTGATGLDLIADTDAGTWITTQRAGSNVSGGGILMIKSRGTTASPTQIQSGDELINLWGGGRTDSGWALYKSAIQVTATENWTSTANGSAFTVALAPNGSPTRAVKLTLTGSGNLTTTGTIGGSNLSGTNTGDQNLFSSIVVSGQTTVTPASTSQALTLVAGTNVTLTTNNTTKTVTIASSGGGGGGGDVVGPASAVDDRIATFDTTTGKLIQDGGKTIPQIDPVGVQTIYLPAAALVPAYTNGSTTLALVPGATNQPDLQTINFDPTTAQYALFSVAMPKSWNLGTVTMQFIWSHPSTTTNFGVAWVAQGVAIGDAETMAANYGTAQTVTDTGATTDVQYITAATSAITIAGTPTAGDTVYFRINRDPSNGSDNLAVAARLHGIRLLYTTSSPNDT